MFKVVKRFLIVCMLVCSFSVLNFADEKTIYWVSDAQDSDSDGLPSDQDWVDFLEDAGYVVNYEYGDEMVAGGGYWAELDEDMITELNDTADLIIISRATNSGDYATDEVEVFDWNGISTPILMQTAYICRSSRWQWLNTTGTMDVADTMHVNEPDHYIFKNVPMIEENKIAVLDTGWTTANISFPVISDEGYGNLLASRADTGGVWIAEWDADLEFYDDTDQFPAGKRMYFSLGESGGSNTPEIGYKNTTEAGDILFLNAVKYLLGDTLDSDVDSHMPALLRKFQMAQNYPNPFNPTTTIRYELRENGLTRLQVFDITGREVAKLVNEIQNAGAYQIDFDASGIKSGIYFYKLTTPTQTFTRKMTVIR